MNTAWGPGPAGDPTPIGAAAAAAVEQNNGGAAPPDLLPDRTPGGLTRLPAREIAFGVPRSVAYGERPTAIAEPPAGYAAEEIARAWVQHVKLVAQDFRGVLSVLPHGSVTKVLAEAGDVVASIARGL